MGWQQENRNQVMQHEPSRSPRVATGIQGLDVILQGGLAANRFYLVQGDPGSGKTTLGLQFLLEGAKHGERGLYVTLSETEEELHAVAESHGWSLDGIALHELSRTEERLSEEEQNTFFHPSEVELNETMKPVLEVVERERPTRVVFDSLSEMRLLAGDPLRYRRQVLAMKQFSIGRKCTVLVMDDRTSTAASGGDCG
jgi:circadian clock protein KaiC